MMRMWKIIMDADHNPLRDLPTAQRYQIMVVLAMMWSFIFCAMLGWWMWFPYWAVGHLALLVLGALVTNRTFETARASHRDRYRSDDGNSARYDDLWGA